jgi:hypothetical protein
MVNKYHSIHNKKSIKNGLMNVGAKPWAPKQDTAFRSSTNPYLDGKEYYGFPFLRKTKMRHMK